MKNFLIIRPDMIGDCMLITPAISALKNKYPGSRISVLIRPYTKDLFLNNPDIDEVIGDRFAQGEIKSLKAFNEYVDFIKSKEFDCSVHFYNEMPYALLAKWAGIETRVGDRSKPLTAPFYTMKSDMRWGDLTLHEVEHNMLLLRPLGIELLDHPPPMKIFPVRDTMLRLTGDHEIEPNELVVGVHIGTGRGNKAWLPDRYAKVIDHLTEKLNAKVVLTGGSAELPASRTVIKLCKTPPIDLVAKTSLSELIALISRYDLYIGVDTGPLHIAAALRIPAVAIFPTKFVKPSEWGPWQTENVIVRKSMRCSQKCRPKECPFDDCLKEITVEDVLDGVNRILGRQGNNALGQSRDDWFKRSLNVCTNREEIIRELRLGGYNAHEIGIAVNPSRLMNAMVKDDINVIHWVGHSRPWALTAAKYLAAPYLPIPPLLIYENNRSDNSAGSLIDLYRRRFRQ